MIFEGASQGDPLLRLALDGWLDDVAAGVTGLVHIFNPELVLIGGGVSAQEELLLKPLRARVLAGVMPRFAERLHIERAVLGNNARHDRRGEIFHGSRSRTNINREDEPE